MTICADCGAKARLLDGVLVMECECGGLSSEDFGLLEAYLDRLERAQTCRLAKAATA